MATGDYQREEYSHEELVALGRADEKAPDAEKSEQVEDKGPEPKAEPKAEEKETPKEEPKTEQKAEPTAEEKTAMEQKGARFENGYVIDEDGERIPLKRFREVYREAKEGERTKERLHLLKQLGPDEFYRIYPDEKPEGWTPPKEKEVDPLDMRAQYTDPNHQFHGLTLREIMKEDPDEARKLYEGYQRSKAEEAQKRGKKTSDEIAQSTREATDFASVVAAEKFGKDDVNDLTEAETEQINELIKETYKWGVQNKKTGYALADMWALKRDQDSASSKAAQDKALRAIEAEKKAQKAVPSIGNGGGSAELSGFEAYEAMSEDALTKAIDRMPDKEMAKFLKGAPKSLRAKYPSIPWD